MKKIIFHIPNHLNKDFPSGSQIRPLKMLHAFRDIGYEPDVVMGYGKERKKQIEQIKKRIKNGQKYDFVYSESSTMPTALTEKNHFPRYPFLDFSFFKFCKQQHIPIGLFYRDIYWKFREYQTDNFLKRTISNFFYRYDIKKYNKLIDTLYLPSLEMANYLRPELSEGLRIKALPPGIEKLPEITKKEMSSVINVFYVGGIGKLYKFPLLMKVVSQIPEYHLVVCVRREEWEYEKESYLPYINKNIEIIHLKGDDVKRYLENATVASIFLKPNEYRNFAMPLKLFEYLEHGKPIIATSGTAVGDFVKTNDVGWTIDYEEKQLFDLLKTIKEKSEELIKKQQNIIKFAPEITWKNRAKRVNKDLTQ